jgi:hypothetical protein
MKTRMPLLMRATASSGDTACAAQLEVPAAIAITS